MTTGPILVPLGSADVASEAGTGTLVIGISSAHRSSSPLIGLASRLSPFAVTCGLSGLSSGAAAESLPAVWMPTWDPSFSTIHPIVVLEPRARYRPAGFLA